MHQTKKCNQWHFGMKAHIGTVAQGYVQKVIGTAANVADVAVAGRALPRRRGGGVRGRWLHWSGEVARDRSLSTEMSLGDR